MRVKALNDSPAVSSANVCLPADAAAQGHLPSCLRHVDNVIQHREKIPALLNLPFRKCALLLFPRQIRPAGRTSPRNVADIRRKLLVSVGS